MPLQPTEPEVHSIALDEINSTFNRLKILADNSENPVERMLAIQLLPVMNEHVQIVTSILLTPGIEDKARQFCQSFDEQDQDK